MREQNKRIEIDDVIEVGQLHEFKSLNGNKPTVVLAVQAGKVSAVSIIEGRKTANGTTNIYTAATMDEDGTRPVSFCKTIKCPKKGFTRIISSGEGIIITTKNGQQTVETLSEERIEKAKNHISNIVSAAITQANSKGAGTVTSSLVKHR